MIQVLNGPIYSRDDRPPFWTNEKVLMASEMDLEHAPIADFPLIEDFEVRLELDDATASDFGWLLYFFSRSRGYVANLALWGRNIERLLIRDDFGVPFGDFERPLYLVEQNWDVIIAAKDNFVYVLKGNYDERYGYDNWFKVRQERYMSEWQKAIQACREAFAKQP